MSAILNVAAYRFVTLRDLPALRQQLHAEALASGLKGTILLAEEGINLFLAGEPAEVDEFLARLQDDPRFAGLTVKRSHSDGTPFRKLRVRIKPEIVTLRQPQVQPAAHPAPAVTPRQLKQWLDQGHDDAGRPLVLLDTRNAFEVDMGTFAGAVHPGLERFSDYPARLPALGDFTGSTVVTFCTGGIRCEKAAPWMLQAGYEHVVQLQGGILQYFEDCGTAHFEGSCFVFDEREALDGQLQPRR